MWHANSNQSLCNRQKRRSAEPWAFIDYKKQCVALKFICNPLQIPIGKHQRAIKRVPARPDSDPVGRNSAQFEPGTHNGAERRTDRSNSDDCCGRSAEWVLIQQVYVIQRVQRVIAESFRNGNGEKLGDVQSIDVVKDGRGKLQLSGECDCELIRSSGQDVGCSVASFMIRERALQLP